MIGDAFTAALFKNILEKSQGIEGRFFVCPYMGREMNSDELGQVIKEFVDPLRLDRKYPLSLMMPPVSYGYYFNEIGEWEKNRAALFFLNSTYYTGLNQVQVPNAATGTSTHTIPQDWHDMKRCAMNFITVLDRVARSKTNQLIKNKFRLDQEKESVISRVTQVGVDKASGVRLDLFYSLMVGCEIEDYDESEIADISIPEDDPHPEHTL